MVAAALGFVIFAAVIGLGLLISPTVAVIASAVMVVLAVAGSVIVGESD